MYTPGDSDVSINNHFDSKVIYCLILSSNLTNNKETSRSANSPDLGLLRCNVGNENVILPF